MKTSRASLVERFWKKVDIRSPDECWNWIAKAKTQFGYGRLTNGRHVHLKSHRVSWELTNGPIPVGMIVCHRCDNPACCNPTHLFLGTKKENTHDMMRKGRMVAPPVRRGASHHNATIPDEDLPAIRLSKLPRKQLAETYGVSAKTIYRIQTGKSRNYEDQPRRY